MDPVEIPLDGEPLTRLASAPQPHDRGPNVRKLPSNPQQPAEVQKQSPLALDAQRVRAP